MTLKEIKLRDYAGLVHGAIFGGPYRWLTGRSTTYRAASGKQVRTLAELCLYNTRLKDIDLRRT
ncbi:MAG: hypothetical protein O7G29_07905 [Acidobacteria bacterium]|nr:hypothetical protein [Acidobacteriota bacterium]